jgi:hypothetical protein
LAIILDFAARFHLRDSLHFGVRVEFFDLRSVP